MQNISFFTSVFKCSKWLNGFLKNITNLPGFENCELILYQPANPEKEAEKDIIKPFLSDNVKLFEDKESLPLYETWNRAIKKCKFDWVSNANPDDRKLPNFIKDFSAEIDSGEDVYYADNIVARNEDELILRKRPTLRHFMPGCSAANLIIYNPPHNAPVWNKKWAPKVGWFSDKFGHAGDHDFWMKCLESGAKFKKIDPVCGIYFLNPLGLSTSGQDNSGSQRIKEKYARRFGYKGSVHGKMEDIIKPLF